MKKMFRKMAVGLAALALAAFTLTTFAACSDGSDSGGGNPSIDDDKASSPDGKDDKDDNVPTVPTVPTSEYLEFTRDENDNYGGGWYVSGYKTYTFPQDGKAIIPEGVTGIRTEVFKNWWYLKSIEIPATVTVIGKDAFAGLKDRGVSLEVSYNGTLNQWAEVDNDSSLLTNAASITLKDGKNLKAETTLDLTDATKIGENAFYGLEKITSVTIPAGMTTIGESAFYGCSSLASVKIPDGVTSIGKSAFSGCTALKSVEIPDSVTTIGEKAFDGCQEP